MKNAKIVLCFLVLASTPAHARWATVDDAEAAVERSDAEYTIKADGTYKVVQESVLEVLREGGRSLANYHITYNSRAESVKIDEAETINGDKKFAVESEFIEDKATATRLNGFDQINMIMIAFPKVSIGSKIHFKYTERHTEVPIEGHFSDRFYFGSHWYTKNKTVKLRSKRPLLVEKNDPNDVVEVVHNKSGDEYETVLRLKKPLFTRAVDEPNPTLGSDKLTWAVVTTASSWADLAKPVIEKYEERLNSELPASFAKMVEKAREAKTTADKLNVITSMLADEVRYMGDWRPIRGGHIPRPLETIAKTKFGDCKDFASSTGAMARKLGLKAEVAWVERGYQATPLPILALAHAFNHAILRVVDPADDRVYWIDPTNFASFAQGIFEDIIGRKALVISKEKPDLDQIPAGKPSDSVQIASEKSRFDSEGGATVESKIEFKGRRAARLAGALIRQSRQQLDHQIITMLTDEDRLKWKKIDDYDLSSRITSDVHFHVEYGERDSTMRTTVGPALHLSQRGNVHLVRLELDRRVSDFFMGAPFRQEDTEFLSGVRVVGSMPPQCNLDTPWLKVSRKITQTDKGLRISDVREGKVSLISNAELKGKEFRAFQQKLRKCFDRVAVVYQSQQGLVKAAGPPKERGRKVSGEGR